MWPAFVVGVILRRKQLRIAINYGGCTGCVPTYTFFSHYEFLFIIINNSPIFLNSDE